MGVRRIVRPEAVTRCAARWMAQRYATGEDLPMTASPNQERLRETRAARRGSISGRETGHARGENGTQRDDI